jgi:hypothetical protein
MAKNTAGVDEGSKLGIPDRQNESALISDGVFAEYSLNLTNDLTLQQYMNLAPIFFKAAQNRMWWIGDYLIFVEMHFGQQVAHVIGKFGYAPKTIELAYRASKAIPPRERRPELTWNHYTRIAKFKTEAERSYWIDLAIKNKWSTRDLGRAIAEYRKTRKVSA